MKYLIVGIICLVIAVLLSCSLKYEISACRHRAVECALVYGEKADGQVAIAIGPSRSTVWHAQAYLLKSNQWLVNTGNVCEIGKQEDFTPQIYMTVREFIQNQFPWVR